MKTQWFLIVIAMMGVACGDAGSYVAYPAKTRVLVVVEKGTSSVGFYSEEGIRVKTVKVDTFPHEMVFSTDRKLAYVTNNGSLRYRDEVKGGETVSILDLHKMELIDEISLLPYRRPHGISLDPESGLLAVSVENPEKVLLIDPVQKQIIDEFDNLGDTPHMVWLAPGGKQLFIANVLSDDLIITSTETGEQVKLPIGMEPQGMALDQARNLLFVACTDYTAVVNLAKKEVTAQIPLGANRLVLTNNDSLLLLSSSQKGVGFVDPQTFEILYHLDLGYSPFSINVSSDGLYAYVAAEPQNLIFIVSVKDMKIVRKFRTPRENRPDPVMDYWIDGEMETKPEPRGTSLPFERIIVDSAFEGAYQVKSADFNGDGLPDLVALSDDLPEIYWYENPSWEKHLICGQTVGNIDLAPKDIDGDGDIDLAFACRFDFRNNTRGGYLYWAQNIDSASRWKLHYIDSLPASHRIRWADLDGDLNEELVNLPIFGQGSMAPEYAVGVELTAYGIPPDPIKSNWQKWVIDTSLHVAHGIQVVRWGNDLMWDVLTASFEGINLYQSSTLNSELVWQKTLIGQGVTQPRPGQGSSEVGLGSIGGYNQPFVATIEPWHGNQVVYYIPGIPGEPWERHLIDSTFNDGHALVCTDLNFDGIDEIIAGHRGPDYSLYIYQYDESLSNWSRSDLDKGGMSAVGLCLLDFDMDGRTDIAACGSATHNVVLYRNAGR